MKFIEPTTYQAQRLKIKAVNPALFKEIERLGIGKGLKLYKASYPYGTKALRHGKLQFINNAGEQVDSTHATIDAEIQKDLNYGINFPMGLVLKNKLELYTETDFRSVPWVLFEPGDIFALSSVLDLNKAYDAGDFWECTAGVRRVFSTLKLSDNRQILKLSRALNCKPMKPKCYADHFALFKEIAKATNSSWRAEVLYFPKEWLPQTDDLKWRSFRCFLHEEIWDRMAYLRQKFLHDIVYSSLTNHCTRLKPNVFVQRLVHHLIMMANGAYVGFTFSKDSQAMPIQEFSEILTTHYDSKGQFPVFVELCPRAENLYYTLAYHISAEAISSRLKFSRKKDDLSDSINLIDELNQLKSSAVADFNKNQYRLIRQFLESNIGYYHNWKDNNPQIQDPRTLLPQDPILQQYQAQAEAQGMHISLDSPFFNGLTRISKT